MKKKLNLFFLLLSFVTSGLFGQELPPIQSFTPTDYNGENQNWMISQASNKFIYVANNIGLLEYNGAKWKMYSSPNNTIIRAVHAVQNKIYTGCYMEFGFWERNSFGELKYQTLVPKFKTAMVEDEHIWNIITYDEWILFQSFNRIYFYNPQTGATSIVNSKNGISRVYHIGNVIYYHVTNEGIYKIEGGQSQLIISDQHFRNDKVVNIFPANEGLLIQTRSFGFYTFLNNRVAEWDIPANEVLKTMNVFNSIQLRDKSFAIGTIKNGLVYLSAGGQIEYQIDRSNGLGNNTALSLFEDIENNLWVGLDYGINCINLKSPIRAFNDNEGKIGTVYTSILFNDYLYLGTNQGLFYRSALRQEPFKFIAGTAGQVWSLFPFKNELFCGHHSGTFLVNRDRAKSISKIPGTWGFRAVPQKDNILLIGNYKGLHILEKASGTWQLKNKIQGFDNSSRYFEFINPNEVWISHGYKGIFKLKIDKTYTSIHNVKIDSTVPIDKNSSLIKFRGRIFYAYNGGILTYDQVKNSFVRNKLLSPIVTQSEYISGKLVVDNRKLWAFSDDNISYVEVNELTNQFKVNQIAFPYLFRKGQVGYENISHLGNNKYLIGITDGYLTLNLSKALADPLYSLYLNAVELTSVDGTNLDVDKNKPGEFDYVNNTVIFNFSVPTYDKFNPIKYQYKLKGRYDQWSEWSSKSELIFENLPFGKYSLFIRAKIGNTLSDNTIQYNFKILRPWFLSNLAILIYLLSVVGFSLFMHKTYRTYYRKLHENKQLESQQLIMQIKNEKLNEAIESKNRELAISTMSIIKKNEVLGSIKKELINNKANNDNTVVELIDANINSSKDWELFEKAFNNTDKDFLAKVKKSHPELSPNDLRFCVYLRLNLSSKEIAPLLNISVRSVETRRYRLRKRMGLAHDDSLIDYILKI